MYREVNKSFKKIRNFLLKVLNKKIGQETPAQTK